jgi:hypothetical protein
MSSNTSIPDSAMLTVEEYLTEREMSDLPVLLVEGNDDSIFFQLIKDELIQKLDTDELERLKQLSCIEIDTAAMIKSPENSVLGNREKVEYICQRADSIIDFTGLLLGFVDREFRAFNIDEYIQDQLTTHRTIGRLVWSRGHSVENYLFEFSTLRNELRNLGISPNYSIQNSLQIFELNFNTIINIASSISLAAKDNDLIKLVESSFDSSAFEFIGNNIQFSPSKWSHVLSSKKRLDDSHRQSLLESLNSYLLTTQGCDTQTLRWLCHGHIGLSLICSAFEACINRTWETESIPNGQRKLRRIDSTDRFIKFSSQWIKQQMEIPNSIHSMPFQCFQILGFIED